MVEGVAIIITMMMVCYNLQGDGRQPACEDGWSAMSSTLTLPLLCTELLLCMVLCMTRSLHIEPANRGQTSQIDSFMAMTPQSGIDAASCCYQYR